MFLIKMLWSPRCCGLKQTIFMTTPKSLAEVLQHFGHNLCLRKAAGKC